MDEIYVILAIVAIAGAIVALGVWLLPKLKNEEQGYPYEAEIEAVLVPLIFQGICSAYRVSEWGMEQVGQKMAGLDKKAIANAVYALLPDQIGKFPLYVVKRIVTPERFEQLVQNVFDQFDRHFATFEGKYGELFDEWAKQFEVDPKDLMVGPGSDTSSAAKLAF